MTLIDYVKRNKKRGNKESALNILLSPRLLKDSKTIQEFKKRRQKLKRVNSESKRKTKVVRNERVHLKKEMEFL